MERKRPHLSFFGYRVCTFLLALFWHPTAWYYLRHDFLGKDTLFDLSIVGQIGLALITLFLIAGLLGLNLLKSRFIDRLASHWSSARSLRSIAPLIDLVVTVFFFVAALAITPQLHYLYYMQLFDGLPLQWVGAWPDYSKLHTFVSMNPIDSLNTMMSGLVFWSMLAGVLLFWLFRYTNALERSRQIMIIIVVLGSISVVFHLLGW